VRIFNVRLGLATNSSSNHSLIFLPDGIHAEDYPGYHHAQAHWAAPDEDRYYEFGDFGWQRFTLASPELKLRYLAVMLRTRLEQVLPSNVYSLVIKDWLDNVRYDDEDYIDHESHHYLPLAHGTNLPDEQFVRMLKDYFLHDRLVVLGDNDNESAVHPLADGSNFKLEFLEPTWGQNVVCRFDDRYNFWTLFNQTTGSKLRFRLEKGKEQESVEPEKASAPELVDVKITDFCPHGCEYCYQGATLEGKHANNYDVSNMADALAAMKVFEVAIGGGEPTYHPEFLYILQSFRKVGIVPNFTTKNIQWLRDPRQAQPILEACGGFALSVTPSRKDALEEIKELAMLAEFNGVVKDRISIHVVMGTIDKWDFNQLMKAANDAEINVTLLGYKSVGFGANFRPKDYGWWLNEVKEASKNRRYGAKVSIDTVLASEHEEQILAADVPKWMFSTKEGAFSCYIDMVGKKIGPSSFCKPEEMVAIDGRGELTRREGYYERVLDVFSRF
jgi:hypothetical protein